MYEHKLDLLFLRIDEQIVRFSSYSLDHHHIGHCAALEYTEVFLPPDHGGGVGGNSPHQVPRTKVCTLVLDYLPRHFQLLQEVLAAGRRPVAADTEEYARFLQRAQVES